jgi:hypothetical protein
MKLFPMLLMAVASLAVSCKKSAHTAITYTRTATYKGPVQWLGGPLCWGKYWLTIDDTSFTTATFDVLPPGSKLDISNYPARVNLNWHNDPECPTKIVVDAIEKVN